MRGELRHLPLLALMCLLPAIPAQADTLQDALAQTYRSNPDLLAARATLRAADQGVPIERADGLPSISSTGRFNEFLYESGDAPGPERQFSGQVSLGVPIYAGGGIRNAVRGAERRVLASRADLRGAESAIFSQVVATYMDVIRQEAIVGLSANNVQVLTINLEASSDRYEIGDLTRTDVAQSEARLALARGSLRAAQANLVSARENYIALVGDAPDDLQPPPPLPGLPDDVGIAVQTALGNNPDLQAAVERAAAAGHDIKVAGSTRLPRIEITTSADYSEFLNSLPPSLAAVTRNSSSAVTAGVRMTIPIYQAGRPTALQRRAQANASAALERTVAVERGLIAQVRSAYSSWQAADAIIASTQTATAAAELSLEGVRAENTVGNRSILEILDAQQELLGAQVQLVTARRNAYVAGFSLLAAMGRAEARDLGLEEYGPLYDPIANYDRAVGTLWDWTRDPDPEAQSTRTVDIEAQDAEIQTPEFP